MNKLLSSLVAATIAGAFSLSAMAADAAPAAPAAAAGTLERRVELNRVADKRRVYLLATDDSTDPVCRENNRSPSAD